MKMKREFSGYPIANIREEIEKISKHFDDVLDLMAEAMVAEELKASDPTLSEDALKKRFEELRQQPDKLQELRDNELDKSFKKLKETVPHEFNGLDDLELTKKVAKFKVHEYNRRLQSFKKEEVAKKFKEFKGQDPDTFNALKKDELTKLKKPFSDVSTLWDKKCTIMQEILSHTQIATVLVSLSDKIFANLRKITAKAKKDKEAAESFIQKQDEYKEKWLTDFPELFDNAIGACQEVRNCSVIAAGSQEMAKDVHELVQEFSHDDDFAAVITKLNKSQERNYRDINISESEYLSLHQLLDEAQNPKSDKKAIAERMSGKLTDSLSIGRRLSSWVEKVHTGNNDSPGNNCGRWSFR